MALRAFDETLRTIAYAGEEPVLREIVPLVREFLEADQAIAYRFAQHGDALDIDFHFTSGMGPDSHVRAMGTKFLSRTRGQVTAYTLPTPGPDEQNAVHRLNTPEARRRFEEAPIVRELFPLLGLAGQDQIRVLLCEGSHLLSWIGAFRLDPFGDREAERLEMVIEPLVKRLRLEERLRRLSVQGQALEMALDTMGIPAFILDHRGRVTHANEAGRALPRDERQALLARAKGGQEGEAASDPRFHLLRIQANGLPPHSLLLGSPGSSFDQRLAAFVRRWQPTKRQVDVLIAILEGKPNKHIAETLGIQESTVEFHVTSLLRKVGVESRAELTAAFWSA